MQRYIARRILLAIPTLVGVTIIVFAVMRMLPGDISTFILGGEQGSFRQEEIDAVRKQLGLDRPLYQQYFSWIGDLIFRFDAGLSLRTNRPVIEEIGAKLPVSVELGILSLLIGYTIAIPVGVISAMRQDAWVDYLFRVVSILGLAVPSFWLGTLTILVLLKGFDWVPPISYVSIWQSPRENMAMLIWPSLILGYTSSALVSRMVRSSLLEVLRQDYIRTAWAKGLRERLVIVRHALKNAFLPVITIMGVQVGILIGGVVIMETVFNVPGMGRYLVTAITQRDYMVVQNLVLLFALVFVGMNLLVDLLYGWLDPRIRYT